MLCLVYDEYQIEIFFIGGKDNRFGFTGTSKSLLKASEKLSKKLYICSTHAGTVTLTCFGAYASSFHPITSWKNAEGFLASVGVLFNCWWFFLIGFILLHIGSVGIYQDQSALEEKNKKLEKENASVVRLKNHLNGALQDCETLRAEKQNLHKQLVNTWLQGASKQLGLNTNERITVYYEYNKNFYLLSRYSLNPHLKEEHRHRQTFRIDRGVLSQAWQHQECIDIDCPIFYEDEKKYCDYLMDKYEYDCKKLTMKSCSYIGKAITDAGNHIGVIIFESETKDLFTKERIEEICKYCDEYQSHMSQFVRDALALDRSRQAKFNTSNPEQELLNELKNLQKQ